MTGESSQVIVAATTDVQLFLAFVTASYDGTMRENAHGPQASC